MLFESILQEFQRLIDERKFYEAHEILEVLWFPNRHQKTPFYNTLKGFINASVSFELYKRGRVNQSKQVWNNYLKLVHIDELDDIELKTQMFKVKHFLDDVQSSIYNR